MFINEATKIDPKIFTDNLDKIKQDYIRFRDRNYFFDYSHTYNLTADSTDFETFITLIGLIIIFNTFLSLVSLFLGLVGIFQKTRVRKFAFIGTTISSAILIVYLSVIIVSF